jgi:diguanylate cyclase (GGDEF)-like protein
MTTSPPVAGLPEILASAEKLPSPPLVALELLKLTADQSVNIAELTACISRDPALTIKLLKLANSTFFRRAVEVTTLERATLLLGLKTVRFMALSFSLVGNVTGHKGTVNGFDYAAYWRQSVVGAVAARALARLVKNPLFDEAFLCGLLARFGQLAMAQCMPERYRDVCAHAPHGLPEAEIERRLLGFDHHEVGGALLDAWSLPKLIPLTVRHLADPDAFPAGDDPALNDLPYVMNLAGHATTLLCDSRKGPALRALTARAQERFGLAESAIDALLIGLEDGVAEMASLFEVHLAAAESHQDILERARMQVVTLSVETAMDLEETVHRAAQLEREKQDFEEKAHTDPLTGIRNRAFFDAALEEAVGDRVNGRTAAPLGVLILDIDRFKGVNDTHGHAAGDEVLRMVARCLRDVTRARDVAARYGGEEFVVILRETSSAGLLQVAERIRTAVEASAVEIDGTRLAVTVSVGGACCSGIYRHTDGLALLKIADQCLYEAKREGRNRSFCREVRRLER